MTTQFQYLYLHGFRSDVQSTKGLSLQKRLAEKGIKLQMFDVKAGKGHEDTRVSMSLQALGTFYHENKKPLRLIGSSMGGFIAATYASQQPTHVDRLILLNPAVNLKETWTTIADTEDESIIEKWKAEGNREYLIEKTNELVKIPYAYVEDSLQYPSYPDVPCPAIIIVGTQDKIIPPKYGYVMQLEQENPDRMKLVELDDDHDFLKESTIDRIFEEAVEFFA